MRFRIYKGGRVSTVTLLINYAAGKPGQKPEPTSSVCIRGNSNNASLDILIFDFYIENNLSSTAIPELISSFDSTFQYASLSKGKAKKASSA